MAKKSRRARRQERPRPAYAPTAGPASQVAEPWATVPDQPAPLATPASRKQVDFSNEYRYVISDLRSMAIIAIAMLAVLVALSFIIR